MHRSIQKVENVSVEGFCGFFKKLLALIFGFIVLIHVCVNEHKTIITGRECVRRSFTICIGLRAASSSGLRSLFLKMASAREGTSFSASVSESISPISSLNASSSRASIFVKITTRGTLIKSSNKWTTLHDERLQLTTSRSTFNET